MSVMPRGSLNKYISFLFKLTLISQGSNCKLLFVTINTQFSMLSFPFWKCPRLEISPGSMGVLEMKNRFCGVKQVGFKICLVLIILL